MNTSYQPDKFSKTGLNTIGVTEAKGYSLNEDYANVNQAYPVGEVPSPDNSKRKTDSSQLPANQDAPAHIADGSC
jgi:hypothetical protein